MASENLIGKHKSALRTPCLLLDLDAVDRNIRKMADAFDSSPCKLRPHAKTHKLPLIAHKQIAAGAIGITCAKLQDAKAFVAAGIDNILIANQIVTREKIEELVGLLELANVMVCVDNEENARSLSRQAQARGRRLDVLVEVNVGLNRCGVPPGEPALAFLRQISELKGIRCRGLMGYEGGLFVPDEGEKLRICQERNQRLVETRQLIEANGFPVEIVSAGGTNTYQITGACPGITEIQPGSYVTMDDWTTKHGVDFGQAITVLTTVISRPHKHRAVTDAGSKSISTDHGLPRILDGEGITIEALNEEHGRLVLTEAASVQIGDRLEIVPTHGCTTRPLHDRYVATRDDRVVAELEIITRGAVY